jgi:hypothetical protein
LKKYKSPSSDQIPAELIQAGGEMLLSAIHKLINSIWNKEELPDQWKESIIVPIHKNGGKANSNNYRGISLISTSYKILLDIHLEFQHNRSTSDQPFCIHQILEKKMGVQ